MTDNLNFGALLKDRRGGAAIEFTVMTTPVLVATLFLLFEAGRGLWAHHVVAEGVRTAARYLSRTAVTSTTRITAENLARYGTQEAGASQPFPWSAAATVTINPAVQTFDNAVLREAGTVLEVRAVVPFRLAGLAVFGIDPALSLVAADQIRHFGE